MAPRGFAPKRRRGRLRVVDSIPSRRRCRDFGALFLGILATVISRRITTIDGLILSGAPESFARYPKWAQTYENQMSFEFKTRVRDALLLYTDDGAVHSNFYALSIVDGRIQLDFRLGDESEDSHYKRPPVQIRISGVTVNDNRWHRFTIFQAWENVKIQVDDTIAFKILEQRSFVFGNLRTNSDVFIGGLPKDIHEMSRMSSPLRRHARRFAGSVRNLFYRLYPQGVSSPQLIDSYGTRQTDDDYCGSVASSAAANEKTKYNIAGYSTTVNNANASALAVDSFSYCKHGGRCYSANTGPKCDCAFTDYGGRQCDIKKTVGEVSFFGDEWLGYDLTNISATTAGPPSALAALSDTTPWMADAAGVWSRRETLELAFKTSSPNGLLFVAGDYQNYVQLLLEKGVLLAVSQLHGSEKRIIRVFNRSLKPARFDDNVWHCVVLYRDLSLMRLTVDSGWSDEVKQLTRSVEWLGNSFAFVGGAPVGRLYVPIHGQQFRGCMKKIKFEADAIQLDMIELADQGFGKSVVRTSGDLSFSCTSPEYMPDVLSFNSGQEFLQLPKWNSLSSGSLAFQFRTREADGLLLYHGVKHIDNHSTTDYIAFEMIDGHLFVVINLGSGHVRLQATSKRMDDAIVWHSVTMERVGRSGTITVDGFKTDFSTPGVSANLIIDEPIYVGAAPWPPVTMTGASANSAKKAVKQDLYGALLLPKNDSGTVPLAHGTPLTPIQFPSTVWTAQLRLGFVGCLKNLRINGINAQIAKAFEEELKRSPEIGDDGNVGSGSVTASKPKWNTGISKSCHLSSEIDYCTRNSTNPCQNYGRCEPGHNTFKCDCSMTLFDGPTCAKSPKIVTFPVLKASMIELEPSTANAIDRALKAQRLDINEPTVFRFPVARRTESEDVELRFRTDDDSAVLFDTAAPYAAAASTGTGNAVAEAARRSRLLLLLSNGELELSVWLAANASSKHTFNWGSALNDNHWHFVRVKRRGDRLTLVIDGKSETKIIVDSETNFGVYVEEIAVGKALRAIDGRTNGELSDESHERSAFEGEFLTFYFNRYDVMEPIRRFAALMNLSKKVNNMDETAPQPSPKETVKWSNDHSVVGPANTVSIHDDGGFLLIDRRRVDRITADALSSGYRIAFRFRTLAANGLLMLMVNDDESGGELPATVVFAANGTEATGRVPIVNAMGQLHGDYVKVELESGRVKYTYGYKNGKAQYSEFFIHTPLTLTPTTRRLRRFDDLRWHTIHIHQDGPTGIHQMYVDNVTVYLAQTNPRRIAQIKGRIFLGGLPTNFIVDSTLSSVPDGLRSLIGYRGCLSNFKLAKDHLNLWAESALRIGVKNGCTGPTERCAASTCRNGGICHQDWKSIHCDCSLTTFAGTRCELVATTYFFDGRGASVFYEYPTVSDAAEPTSPSTVTDKIVLAFETRQANGVLLAVQCLTNDDYLTLFLDGGYVQVRYNLGSRDNHLGYFDVAANDGRRHVVRVWRNYANLTLSLDDNMPIKYSPSNQHELFTLNAQWRIVVGASMNALHTAVPRRRQRRSGHVTPISPIVHNAFTGNISGVHFNELRILDMLAVGHNRVFKTGNPRLIKMTADESVSSADGGGDGGTRRVVSFGSPQAKPKPYINNLFTVDDEDADKEFLEAGVIPSTSSSPSLSDRRKSTNESRTQGGDSLFNQSPLGCLPYEAATDCEREESVDGFFTPVLPRTFHRTPPTPTTTTAATARRIPPSAATARPSASSVHQPHRQPSTTGKTQPRAHPTVSADSSQKAPSSPAAYSSVWSPLDGSAGGGPSATTRQQQQPNRNHNNNNNERIVNNSNQNTALMPKQQHLPNNNSAFYRQQQKQRLINTGNVSKNSNGSGNRRIHSFPSVVDNSSQLLLRNRTPATAVVGGPRPNNVTYPYRSEIPPIKNWYEPPGGWPPRTRTGPDGRRILVPGRGSRPDDQQTTRVRSHVKISGSIKGEEESENEEEEETEDDEAVSDEPEEEDETESGGISSEEPQRFYNELGQEISAENGKKVKNLWADLGRVIERKPWQTNVTAAASPQKQQQRSPQAHLHKQHRFSTTKPPTSPTTTAKPTTKLTTLTSTTRPSSTITKSKLPLLLPSLLSSTPSPSLITSASPETVVHFTFVAGGSNGSPTHQVTKSGSGGGGGALNAPLSGYGNAAATSSASTTLRHRALAPYDPTLYAVRPTTPMDNILYPATKAAGASSEIPRTALVVLASLGLVVLVAVILICVFCKRSSSSSENYYPMICTGNGKTAAAGGGSGGGGVAGGYTPIPPSTDASPQFQHVAATATGNGTAICDGGYTNKAMTLLPSALRNGGASGGGIMSNGGGYQPIKGSTLPHPPTTANGHSATGNGGGALMNGHGGGGMRQTTASLMDGGGVRTDADATATSVTNAKKKDFKEWYV